MSVEEVERPVKTMLEHLGEGWTQESEDVFKRGEYAFVVSEDSSFVAFRGVAFTEVGDILLDRTNAEKVKMIIGSHERSAKEMEEHSSIQDLNKRQVAALESIAASLQLIANPTYTIDAATGKVAMVGPMGPETHGRINAAFEEIRKAKAEQAKEKPTRYGFDQSQLDTSKPIPAYPPRRTYGNMECRSEVADMFAMGAARLKADSWEWKTDAARWEKDGLIVSANYENSAWSAWEQGDEIGKVGIPVECDVIDMIGQCIGKGFLTPSSHKPMPPHLDPANFADLMAEPKIKDPLARLRGAAYGELMVLTDEESAEVHAASRMGNLNGIPYGTYRNDGPRETFEAGIR